MASDKRITLATPPPDPFGEQHRVAWRERVRLLGGEFEFETDSHPLLRIVRAAYAHLPAHQFNRDPERCRVRLIRAAHGPARAARDEPPPLRALSGAGILCGAPHDASFIAVTPQQRAALIVVAAEMLRYPYHVRYELLEFAVYLLAARVQGLVPLHAACVARDGAGVLLIGRSGTGKSTLVLHALLHGLELLAEDSVLVDPASLKATGVANFVHLRRDALRFNAYAERRALLKNCATIRRRSGVEKLEIDLRGHPYRLAAQPPRLRALVFLSRRSVTNRTPLIRLSAAEVHKRLAASQRYASQQSGWSAFRTQIALLPAYELRRSEHPAASVEALSGLVDR
jgi:hypothetical protein